jgi:hydroxymethylpyrimidine/phosphomethylpyrimidine kinase
MASTQSSSAPLDFENAVIPEIPVALTIAGSDCCAGAGIQADLKVLTSLRVHGLTAITAVVAETPNVVEAIHPVSGDLLSSQLRLLLEAYPVSAAKTGMLPTAETIAAAVPLLVAWKQDTPGAKLVVDPIITASSKRALMENPAFDLMQSDLLPLADLVTPNADEARALLGETSATPGRERTAEDLALALFERYQRPILLKGGHAADPDLATDVLVTAEGTTAYSVARLPEAHRLHGTGCTLSAAITGFLAKGHSLENAVADAKAYLTCCLEVPLHWDGVAALGFGGHTEATPRS